MSYYQSPEISDAFTISFFLGLVGLGVIRSGQPPEAIKTQERLLTSVLSRPSVKGTSNRPLRYPRLRKYLTATNQP